MFRSAIPNSRDVYRIASLLQRHTRRASFVQQFSRGYRRRLLNASRRSSPFRGFHNSPMCLSKTKASLQLFDSLSQSVKSIPDTDKGLACYTCGPTTYAPSHLGHARTYVCLDILRRVLEYTAILQQRQAPLFVMNITDVDDKILAAAEEAGEPPLELAHRHEAAFWNDLDALNCLRPHVVTRVTEHVDSDIVPYIQHLIDNEMAYETSDGVYFDVKAYEDQMQKITKYGKLAPPSDSYDFYTRLEEETEKRDPRDFAVWKKRKPGERMYWASPWGEGRPGWHIECSAMIEAVQQQFDDTHTFLIHAGGVDLQFPHHTNEIAQAEAYHLDELKAGQEWIPHWVHTGHLHIDGLKMSKSLKNFITIHDLLSENTEGSSLSSPADDFRLWCLGLSGSHRAPATYSPERLLEARTIRQKIVRFLLDGEEWIRKAGDEGAKKWGEDDKELWEFAGEVSNKCLHAITTDLDGATYAEELVQLAESGSAYIRHVSPAFGSPDAVRSAIKTLRDLLSLVGFSDATCRAGRGSNNEDRNVSHVVGGERDLLDELVRFRAAVRQAANADLRDGAATESVQEIMRLCDDARDRVFPALGVDLLDGKVDEHDDEGSLWKLCIPRTDKPKDTNEARPQVSAPSLEDLRSIPLEDFFRVGQYEGRFSEYDKDGIPTLNADGTEVSNRLRKKLTKKRNKHAKRLANDT